MMSYTTEKLLIEALEDAMEYTPGLFSFNTQRQVLYRGRQIPESVLVMLNPGVYQNLQFEIISQAEQLKREILTREELALSA